MARERLSSADRSALAFETLETPMHVLAILWLGAPAGGAGDVSSLDVLRGHVARRLDQLPRLRQVVRGGSGLLGNAEWVDAEAFDIARHVTETALPEPGSEVQLLEHAATMFMEPFDRAHPLWELRLVRGLVDDGTALLVKIHHAIADGPAAVRLLGNLFDAESEVPVTTPRVPSTRSPHRRTLLERIRRSLDVIAELNAAPRSSIDRPVGRGRRLAVVRLPLHEVKTIAHGAGAKANDVLLTLAAAGVAAVLARRGEVVPGGTLRASIFVGLQMERATLGNATGVMTVPLPVDEPDPRRVLVRVAAATAAAKARQPAAGIAAISYLVTRAGLGNALYRRQRQVNVFTTNVVGPRTTLSLLGRPVCDLAAVTALGGNVGVSFAALSYVDRFNITIVGDAVAFPDVDLAAAAMRSSWDTLVRATVM